MEGRSICDKSDGMEKLREELTDSIQNLRSLTVSNARKKGEIQKIKYRPVLIKGEILYQETVYMHTQVLHHNYAKEDFTDRVCELLQHDFKQAEWDTASMHVCALVSKKGVSNIKKIRQDTGREIESFSHNRKKHYILDEGNPVDFLIELGVMTKEGKVVHSKYDKFRQINRFLEFIEDILQRLPSDREVRIIDFGCGKSYLTFAMYYYLHMLKHYEVRITGLDLKKDVIADCSRLKDKLGYEKLEFLEGDIAHYEGQDAVDMVVTLHACDTATDYALWKAVNWGAGVILSVPCCQHELNRQIQSDVLAPVLSYGLIRERMSALFTDAMRAQLLEQQGYQVSVLEFIDMEHTPKNILIRAVRTDGAKKKQSKDYDICRDFIHADLTLEKLLKGEKHED